jgi:hypothetical protein
MKPAEAVWSDAGRGCSLYIPDYYHGLTREGGVTRVHTMVENKRIKVNPEEAHESDCI